MSVVKEIMKLLPGQKISYYADSAHCPYGKKTPEYIQGRARTITDILLKDGADIIVIACNTATAAAVTTLREEYPSTHFIGMEPAVKPAAHNTLTGVVGILATQGTLSGDKYQNTRDRFAGQSTIVEHAGEGFVELVESNNTEGPEAEATVRHSLEPLIKAGADQIVLGCTHYPFLKKTIAKVAEELAPERKITIIDPAPAIARHLREIMTEEGISLEDNYHKDIIRSSDPAKQPEVEDIYKRILYSLKSF